MAAAAALDSRTLGALDETCVGTSCHYRLEISSDGGVTWSLRPTMPRYGPDNRVNGLVALDADHWFAYGTSGWSTSDAGLTWHRSKGDPVTSAGRAGSDLWLVRAACRPGSTCHDTVQVLSPSGAVVAHSGPSWPGPGWSVSSLLWNGRSAYAVVGSQAGGRLDVLSPALVPLASHPLPKPGAGSLVRDGSGLDLLSAWDPAAGNQPKMFWHSADDGRTWQRRPDPLTSGYAVSLQAPRAGLLWRFGGRSAIWRSTDDGRTWTALLVKPVLEDDHEVQAFTSFGNSAWVFAFFDDSPRVGVYRTADAGVDWEAVPLP